MSWFSELGKEAAKIAIMGPGAYFFDKAKSSQQEEGGIQEERKTSPADKAGLDGIEKRKVSPIKGIETFKGNSIVVIRKDGLNQHQLALHGKIGEAAGRAVELRDRFNQTDDADPAKKEIKRELEQANLEVRSSSQAFKRSLGIEGVSRFILDEEFNRLTAMESGDIPVTKVNNQGDTPTLIFPIIPKGSIWGRWQP